MRYLLFPVQSSNLPIGTKDLISTKMRNLNHWIWIWGLIGAGDEPVRNGRGARPNIQGWPDNLVSPGDNAG